MGWNTRRDWKKLIYFVFFKLWWIPVFLSKLLEPWRNNSRNLSWSEKTAFKEYHVKIFNTGKMEIPGVQSDEMYKSVINLIISTLSSCNILGINGESLTCHEDKTETVLINSNFNCGFYIDRDEM